LVKVMKRARDIAVERYCRLELEMATEVWAKEVEGTALTINIVNPGAGANTPGMAEEMRDESRRPRSAPRRAGGDGGATALCRLARGRHGQRLALRRQSLGHLTAAGRGCSPRRPAGFEMHPQPG
jgi:NAD(P)-dependent dehydrogenase (short-subunit alcohol dehydrogenase family)